MRDPLDPGTIEMPLPATRGRPRLPESVKRERRNARLRQRRKEQREQAQQQPNARTRVRSPFVEGLALLDGMMRAAAPSSTEDVPVAPGSAVSLPLSRFEHQLTDQQFAAARMSLMQQQRHQVTGLAKSTLASIRSCWRNWLAFCLTSKLPILPVESTPLSDFVMLMVNAGYKRKSIEQHLFAIAHMSDLFACPNPTTSAGFKLFWRGVCRERLSSRASQAPGLNIRDLNAMLEAADPDDPVQCRTAALAAVMYDGLLRISEVVALNWSNLTPLRVGGATLLITRSKTDQHGDGHQVYLSPATVQALERWRHHTGRRSGVIFHAVERDGPVKPLSISVARTSLARLAVVAGTAVHGITGHSARVGATQDMTEMGLSLPEIMQIGRWKNPQMPSRYAEHRDAANAGRKRLKGLEKILEDGQP